MFGKALQCSLAIAVPKRPLVTPRNLCGAKLPPAPPPLSALFTLLSTPSDSGHVGLFKVRAGVIMLKFLCIILFRISLNLSVLYAPIYIHDSHKI